MNDIFYVGVDLGTSRTSIATSTGKRFTTSTCVGFTKDVISFKRFQCRRFLLGEEAIKHRLSLNMVWPLEKGVVVDSKESREAVRIIIDYVLSEVFGDYKSKTIYGAIGVPAQASIDSKQIILEIFDSIIDRVLIV